MENTIRFGKALIAAFSMITVAVASGFEAPDATFGLTKGTKMIYDQQLGNGKRVHVAYDVEGLVKVGAQEVADIQVVHPEYAQHQYMAAKDGGLYRYENAYLGNMPGVNEEVSPTVLLKPGATAGSTWTWVERLPFQTGGRVTPQQTADLARKLTLNWKAEVESVDESVTTPAGTFRVVVVRYESTSEAFGHQTTRRWISSDAGILREEGWKGNDRRTLEMTSITKG